MSKFKRSKRKRLRKAYLKPYTPKFNYTGHHPESIKYAGWTAPEGYTFGEELPKTKMDPFTKSPRIDVLKTMETMVQSDRMTAVEKWQHVNITNNDQYQITMLFCRDLHFFIKRIKYSNLLKRSYIYESRDEALAAYKHGIRWHNKVYDGYETVIPNTS